MYKINNNIKCVLKKSSQRIDAKAKSLNTAVCYDYKKIIIKHIHFW